MPSRTSLTGCELFIVDNSGTDWKVLKYLHDWCRISKAIYIATGYFEIGSLLAIKGERQKIDGAKSSAFRRGRPFLAVHPFSLTITDHKL
jgi:hypothetical protein